jgi:hypothetical protein
MERLRFGYHLMRALDGAYGDQIRYYLIGRYVVEFAGFLSRR